MVVWFTLYERSRLCHLPIRTTRLLLPVSQAGLLSKKDLRECLIVKSTVIDRKSKNAVAESTYSK